MFGSFSLLPDICRSKGVASVEKKRRGDPEGSVPCVLLGGMVERMCGSCQGGGWQWGVGGGEFGSWAIRPSGMSLYPQSVIDHEAVLPERGLRVHHA